MSAADSTTPVVWKEVPGFPGYRASSEGSIETQWRNGKKHPLSFNKGKPYRTDVWEPVKTSIHIDGYIQFNVPAEASHNGKRWRYTVHYFVCLAFHGLPQLNQEVRHFPDSDPTNNRPENLSWGTHTENINDMVVHGTDSRGEKSGNAKLTEAIVIEMWHLKYKGWTNTAIAEKYGVTQANVCNIFARRAWSWLTPPQLDAC